MNGFEFWSSAGCWLNLADSTVVVDSELYCPDLHLTFSVIPDKTLNLGPVKNDITSVADPNPDPHVFGPPGSGSISQRYGSGSRSGSGSGSFYHQAKKSKKNLDSYCFVTSF
jgi:hypothetical protein